MTERRILTIVLVAVLLGGAGLADRARRPEPAAVPAAAIGPQARPIDGGASTWYCPLATAQSGGAADGTIDIENTRGTPLDGVVSMFPASGPPVTQPVRAAARSRLSMHEADFLHSPGVGAVVEFKQGGVAVEQTITGAQGESTTPCATGAGDEWYVAEGSTALNNSMFLGLFNPFPDDAITDMDFATDQGRAAPGVFQGVVVPARSVVVVNVGDHVRRRDHVAARIRARRGRIVVGRIQVRTQPRNGLVAALAAPATRRLWDFPDGISGDTAAERFHFYNPSSKEATVQLALTLDQGAAEPFDDIKVPAGGRLTFDPGSESRVPKGVGHSATVRSNVPIVVERSIDYAPPTPRTGLTLTLGAVVQARHWLLPQGGVGDTSEEWVVVHNRGRRRARVTLVAVTGGHRIALEGLTNIDIPAGQRRSIRLLDSVAPRPDLPLAVDATQPVVVERVLARVGRAGVSQTIAIPVGD
jgi:hypothetical protein